MQKNEKQQYLKSVQQAHMGRKEEHSVKKQSHEQRLEQLAHLEERMIGSLQNTLSRKNQAIDSLHMASPSLKKAMEPRMAYKYKPKPNSNRNMHMTHSGSG